MAEHSPNMVKDINSQTWESQRTSNRIISNNVRKHNNQNAKDIFKPGRKPENNDNDTYKRTVIQMAALRNHMARKEWNTFRVMKEENCQHRSLYPEKKIL